MKNLNTEIYKEICKHYDHLIENMIEDGLKPFKDTKEEANYFYSKETKKIAELRAMNVGQDIVKVSVGDFNCQFTLEQAYLMKRKFEQMIPKNQKHFYCTRIQDAIKELTPLEIKPMETAPVETIKKQSELIVVHYSLKALGIFGDTKPIREDLKGIGARFNPFLTHEGKKQAGWVLPISKKETLINLLKNI